MTVVPFGKYRGQPVEVLLADRDYCNWAAGQPSLRERYPQIFQVILSNGGPLQDSPKHNEMQARFLDAGWCEALVKTVYAFSDDDEPPDELEVSPASFEIDGWDVVIPVIARDKFVRRRTFAVELKPDLGDDYPSVLRQVMRYKRGYPVDKAVLLVRGACFGQVSWNQVCEIFARAEITAISETEMTERWLLQQGTQVVHPYFPPPLPKSS